MSAGEEILIGAVTEPASPPEALSAGVLNEIDGHDLAPLAWDSLMTAGCADAWPEVFQRSIRRTAGARSLASEILDGELRSVVAALGAAGVRAVVIKGAALAYTHYRRPHLRGRNDSDVVVDEADRDAAVRVLAQLGYFRSRAVDGALVTQQSQWT